MPWATSKTNRSIEKPIPVGVGVLVRALEGVPPQVEQLRQAQVYERLAQQAICLARCSSNTIFQSPRP